MNFKNNLLKVIYKAADKSSSADLYVFFSQCILAIQCKNVQEFNINGKSGLIEEIKKTHNTSTTQNITLVIVARQLSSTFENQCTKFLTTGNDAYKFSKGCEFNEYQVPGNMEVFVLTQKGFKHFLGQYNSEALGDFD